MDFTFFTVCLELVASRAITFPPFGAANLIRGQFGRELFQNNQGLYRALFAPPRRTSGPSGLKDPPRPYVLRTSNLDARTFAAGDALVFHVNVFDQALLTSLASSGVEQKTISLIETRTAQNVQVDFLTPTEFKESDEPTFGVLFSRLRDRISALRSLYGVGPLEIDFKAMGERAAAVQKAECVTTRVEMNRTSHASGQRHSIGGFVGRAMYAGDLGEFLPFLEAGFHTGVGRQTVWGKGQIQTTVLPLCK